RLVVVPLALVQAVHVVVDRSHPQRRCAQVPQVRQVVDDALKVAAVVITRLRAIQQAGRLRGIVVRWIAVGETVGHELVDEVVRGETSEASGAGQRRHNGEARVGDARRRCDADRAGAGGGVWIDDHIQEEVVAIAAGAQTRGRNCDPQSSASGFGACTCEVVPLDQQAYRVDRAACPPARWINLFHSWGGRHGPEYSPPAAEAAQHKKEYRPAIRDTKLVHEEKSCAVATHGSASAILLVRGHSVFNQRLYPLVTSPCADDWARIAR